MTTATDASTYAPLEKRLPPLGSNPSGDQLLELFLSYVEELGVTLYPAQDEAILEIFSGHNVVLNTPTGSGKSLVALAACSRTPPASSSTRHWPASSRIGSAPRGTSKARSVWPRPSTR